MLIHEHASCKLDGDDRVHSQSFIFDSTANSPDSALSEDFFDAEEKFSSTSISDVQKHPESIPINLMVQPSTLPRLDNNVMNSCFSVKVAENSPRAAQLSVFCSTPFSTISAEQRLPPSAVATAQRKSMISKQRESSLANLKRSNVLKVKIFYNEEVLAVKLRKDLLSSTKELVGVTLYKLSQRYTFSREQIKLSLIFADGDLKPVSLTTASETPFASFYEDLCMNYIQNKSKIFITAKLK